MVIKALTESWFSNELIPLLQDYVGKGARNLKDLIRLATRNREQTIADYLSDISSREWRDLQKFVFESTKSEKTKRVNITPGMARSMGRGVVKTTCKDCGLNISKYTGAYPKSCPSCDAELNYGEDIDALLTMGHAFINESTDIQYLGRIKDKLYLAFGNKVYAFESKNDPDTAEEEVQECLGNASIIGYLLREMKVVDLECESEGVEEEIVKQRILQLLNENASIDSFWSSSDGKKIKKEREQTLESMSDEDKQDISGSYPAALLAINKCQLLDYVVDIQLDKDLGITTVQMVAETNQEDVNKITESMSQKYNNTMLVQNKKEDEDYIIVVY